MSAATALAFVALGFVAGVVVVANLWRSMRALDRAQAFDEGFRLGLKQSHLCANCGSSPCLQSCVFRDMPDDDDASAHQPEETRVVLRNLNATVEAGQSCTHERDALSRPIGQHLEAQCLGLLCPRTWAPDGR